ncbi:putative MhmaT1 transposase [Trichonephila clavipes]|uniref:Putative MhmaT1 transposase n=1 Tax=Trichonephila clavipes TaxID=2585209 RepID=A0A8X6RLP9_TRICX|nr:putative MhmaT1 transposase [Trichonephila clavipes]
MRAENLYPPAFVKVWWGVSYEGVSKIHFCEKGVKTTAKIYLDTVLEPIVKLVNVNLSNGNDWSFQQDFSSAHMVTQCEDDPGVVEREYVVIHRAHPAIQIKTH